MNLYGKSNEELQGLLEDAIKALEPFAIHAEAWKDYPQKENLVESEWPDGPGWDIENCPDHLTATYLRVEHLTKANQTYKLLKGE